LAKEAGQFAKPLGLLLQSIQDSYSQLALPAEKAADPQAQVQKHFQLLRWYVEKRLTTQAILLAREWVVSALCLCEGLQSYREREARQEVEHQLGSLIQRRKQPLGDPPATGESVQQEEQLQFLPPIAAHVSDVKQLADLWSCLSEYRNDVAHGQMNPDPLSGEALGELCAAEAAAQLGGAVSRIDPARKGSLRFLVNPRHRQLRSRFSSLVKKLAKLKLDPPRRPEKKLKKSGKQGGSTDGVL
jgi:hypothetical protein